VLHVVYLKYIIQYLFLIVLFQHLFDPLILKFLPCKLIVSIHILWGRMATCLMQMYAEKRTSRIMHMNDRCEPENIV
jgi:hypothetical protein